ncbi:MAG: hypothetical protein RJA22_655 [Verrucomicrobiota bacterium]|jgi:hypothetical protein
MFFIAVWAPQAKGPLPATIKTPLGSVPIGFSLLLDAQKFLARSGSPPGSTTVSWAELLAMNPQAFQTQSRFLLLSGDILEKFFADPRTFPYEDHLKELPVPRQPQSQ